MELISSKDIFMVFWTLVGAMWTLKCLWRVSYRPKNAPKHK